MIPAADISAVLQAAADMCGVSVDRMKSQTRAQEVVTARWLAMRELDARGVSLSHIGRTMNRNHGSVHSGLRRLDESLAEGDPRLAEMVDAMRDVEAGSVARSAVMTEVDEFAQQHCCALAIELDRRRIELAAVAAERTVMMDPRSVEPARVERAGIEGRLAGAQAAVAESAKRTYAAALRCANPVHVLKQVGEIDPIEQEAAEYVLRNPAVTVDQIQVGSDALQAVPLDLLAAVVDGMSESQFVAESVAGAVRYRCAGVSKPSLTAVNTAQSYAMTRTR